MDVCFIKIGEKMIKIIIPYLLIILFLAGCNVPNSTHQSTPTTKFTCTVIVASTETMYETVSPALSPTISISTSTVPALTLVPTMKPTATFPSARGPIIHDVKGEVYETVFSIPAGKRGTLKYKIPSCCANIEGPNAIAILSDGSFLISDLLGRQLLKYDREGRMQQTIRLDELGIGYVRDLRVKGNEIFLLETSYQKFRVHRLALDGRLIASEEIPYQFPVDTQSPDYTLENGLTGISVDCEGRIILEVGGVRLFPLSEVQNQADPDLITQGLLCNGERYFVSTPGLWTDPQVTAGEMVYQTRLSKGLGGLHFLEVFEDRSIYLVRDDVMPINPIKVDQTVHYVDENGAVQGVARVPLSEYYYPIMRNTAVSPNGEVFALLPRLDSLDVIRLNFYQELEPLMPGAVISQITVDQSTP